MNIIVFQNGSPVVQGRTASLNIAHLSAREKVEADMALQVNTEQRSFKQAREVLLQAIEAADGRLDDLGLNIRLRVGEKSERLQVEIYDPETKEVIRRIPPDEIIKLAESIEEMTGVMLDRTL